MEVLAVSHHANQGYHKQNTYEHKKFQELIGRAFRTDAGILPTPLKGFSNSKRSSGSCSSSSCSSPETRSPCANYEPEGSIFLRSRSGSSTKPIKIKVSNADRFFNEDLAYYELWAGPAYSNSPPPSSLPIPNFPLSVKRTVSLDLPSLASDDIEMRPYAKSAPPSPTRELYRSHRDISLSADSGTKTLRRIFKLDISNE